ncbi:MAG: hypothetical protein AAF387_18305 [Pseudomonadota bacterium]
MEGIAWEAVSAIAEVIGVIVVTASLVFLGLQVHLNNQEVRHNTDTAKVAAYHQVIDQVVVAWSDPEFAILSERYESDQSSLSAEEERRLRVLWVPALFGHEIALELANKGLIDSRLWENMLVNNLPLLTGVMPMSMLAERRGPLAPKLLEELETLNR